MGLDSVELIMEVEKYFTIQIPDREAEKLTTVQLLVDSISSHRNISSKDLSLRNSVFKKIQDIILQMGIQNKQVELTDKVFSILNPLDKEEWALFKEKMDMEVPRPSLNTDSILGKIKSRVHWAFLYEPDEVNIEQFIAAICSRNCSALINPLKINSQYEIYIAVMRIIVDKIGVDEYEIAPEKSFTDDLGVD